MSNIIHEDTRGDTDRHADHSSVSLGRTVSIENALSVSTVEFLGSLKTFRFTWAPDG